MAVSIITAKTFLNIVGKYVYELHGQWVMGIPLALKGGGVV